MTKDRELLDMAASAAGIALLWDGTPFEPIDKHADRRWNPLADDGDCARLEAALRIDVMWGDIAVYAREADGADVASELFSDHSEDHQKARRYASVRLAAEIGRAMRKEPPVEA